MKKSNRFKKMATSTRLRQLGLGMAMMLGMTALGCDDEAGTTETVTGQENGERCVLSGAGAAICRGDICLGLVGMGNRLGACSESCTDTCRFGGVCAELPEQQRACLVPCTSAADCADTFNCQPVTGAKICTTGDCVNPIDNLFCVPPA